MVIKNARLIDPLNDRDGIFDIAVEKGKIKEIAKNIRHKADRVIDGEGKIAMPALVDIHVHLREPGREDKETIASGSAAAAAGGVTSVVAIANTYPAIDSIEMVRLLKNRIRQGARINVEIAAAITKGRLGKELTDISGLKQEGVVAISDDGASVDNNDLMKEALERAAKEDMLVMCHSEDVSLSKGGVVNSGFTSTKLGLRGISAASEYTRVQRDIDLAKTTGARIHIQHVSCKESVEIIAQAKKDGVAVTCETAPHYFSLSEEAVWGYDTDMKMNPPLRSRKDVEAIKQGLKNGVIDAIASDHAPHTVNEKAVEFDRASFGVIGLETELAAAITELVIPGVLSWKELAEKMALNPAQIIRNNRGALSIDADADIVIISPGAQWVVQKNGFLSKSSNSCFSL